MWKPVVQIVPSCLLGSKYEKYECTVYVASILGQ